MEQEEKINICFLKRLLFFLLSLCVLSRLPFLRLNACRGASLHDLKTSQQGLAKYLILRKEV